LARIAVAIRDNGSELIKAAQEQNLNRSAWATRNLLELAIWSEFSALSAENGNQFYLDALRDSTDMMNVDDAILVPTATLKKTREKLVAQAKQDGLEGVDEPYMRVANIARTLGREKMFRSFNKVLSKFAHPTALTVMNVNANARMIMLQKFQDIGKHLGTVGLEFVKQKLKPA
jgi:hypothetical protein